MTEIVNHASIFFHFLGNERIRIISQRMILPDLDVKERT